MKTRYLSIVLFFFLMFLTPYVFSAKLENYEINIYIQNPNLAYVVENWYVNYNYLNLNDIVDFKKKILDASLDPIELQNIDPNLKPHIYITSPPKYTIKYDDIKNIVTLEYFVSDLILINYFENDKEILWKFNSNLLRYFIINDLYSIPKESSINIMFYSPLIIDDPTPGKIDDRKIHLSGFSSNELKVLALEIKPPVPTFESTRLFEDMSQKGLYNYLIIIFVLIVLVLIFKKRLKSTFKKFVIKYSIIEPKKPKKDLFDSEIIDE